MDNNYINMRNRFFSPEPHQKYQQLLKQRHLRRLRSIGSANKLTSPAHYKQINQVKVGSYTYFKNRILGSGYSSKVYIAHKSGEDGLFAMKVIDLRFFKETNIQMLKNEIQIIRNLNHPNVLRCYDIIKSNTHCYIITQYCPNGDLLSYLNKRGKVSDDKALMIIEQVIKGCQYLAKMNIIHRDLKPANILRSGSTWKIADFGFAIVSPVQFQSQCNVGTPLYMPLESLVQNIYSTKSDIFSIGVMLYQLIIGCTPWQSRSQKDLIRKMKTQSLKIPTSAHISSNIKSLLEKMCDINHETRMDKSQFMGFNIRSYKGGQKQIPQFHILKERPSAFFQKKLQVKKYAHRSAEILPYFKQRCSSPTLPDTEEEEEHAIKKMEIKNNHIIINQLHYCRFLYYFTRNKNYLLLDSKTSQKVVLLVFRHLIILVSQLADKERNWLQLQQWEKFVQSKRYKNTAATIKEYEIRYKKEYYNYVGSIDAQLISEINEEFGDLKQENILSQRFYSKVLQLILQAIKGFSNVIGIIINQQEMHFGAEQIGQIEALNFLYKYYELVKIGFSSSSSYVYFQAHNEIKVHVDYKNSGATVEQYLQLVKKIEKCQ